MSVTLLIVTRGTLLEELQNTEIADIVLKFIYLFGAPRILQSDNGKEFRNKDLQTVVEEFKSRLHGRPYHPQSQGRVERFNRTMTNYFRVKMSTTKNWVDELPYFYYNYNNRVNSVTRPRTPYQQFFHRPNFAPPVEEQIPFENLTREEKEFLNTAHVDVEDAETLDKDEMETEEAGDDNDADQNDQISLEQTLQMLDGGNEECNNTTTERVYTETIHVENDSPRQQTHFVNNTCETNAASTVTEYYKSLYREIFGQYPGDNCVIDRRSLQELVPPMQYDSNKLNVDATKYPVELFAENLFDGHEFSPEPGDLLDYRPNPSMSKGTAVFSSGFWRKGWCKAVNHYQSRGRIYTVVDEITNFSFDLNRHQIRRRLTNL